jgi:hypothetical protein
MSFRYRPFQIAEIVKTPKTICEGQPLNFRSYGERGKVLDVDLDLKDGALVDLRLRVYAGRFDDPTTSKRRWFSPTSGCAASATLPPG